MSKTKQEETLRAWRISEGMRWLLAAIVLIIVFVSYFQSHAIYTTTSYACSRCRSIQHVSTLFGLKSRRVEKTEYSRWFAQSHPQHEHHWCWCGSEKCYYACAIGRACGRQHPLWRLDPELQRQFLVTAAPNDLVRFYA